MVYALYAISRACSVRVLHLTNASLVQISYRQKDHSLNPNICVQTNTSMILKINFANLVRKHAILVNLIKIHAHNVRLINLEFYRDKNAFA